MLPTTLKECVVAIPPFNCRVAGEGGGGRREGRRERRKGQGAEREAGRERGKKRRGRRTAIEIIVVNKLKFQIHILYVTELWLSYTS